VASPFPDVLILNSGEHFRLFLALATPEHIKAAIEKVQQEFRAALPDKAARWTSTQQSHLTLRFLGKVESSRISELVERTQAACKPFPPLQLRVVGLGFFPNQKHPRVLWVGVRDPADQLEALWRATQTATQPFTAEPAESSFVAHITLARLNRMQRPELDRLAQLSDKFIADPAWHWTATHLDLMRSELSPQGARHTAIENLPFLGL